MKKITVILFLLLFCLPAWADKIGYISLPDILEEIDEYKEAKEQFDKEVSEWENQAKELKKEIEDLEQELDKQRLLLNLEKIKERDLVIQTKKYEYQQFLDEIWGESGKIFTRETELTRPIVDKILTTVKEIAAEEKYTVVFDINESNIVYIDSKEDITELVIEKLTEELE